MRHCVRVTSRCPRLLAPPCRALCSVRQRWAEVERRHRESSSEVWTYWRGPAIGSEDVQYCAGCGNQFTGLITATSRPTRHIMRGRPLGELCPRCRMLKGEALAAAKDACRDAAPDAFAKTMASVVSLGPALCLKIVDATDFDATDIAHILEPVPLSPRPSLLHFLPSTQKSTLTCMQVLNGSPVLLAVNKIDLLPPLDDKGGSSAGAHHRLEQYMKRRLQESAPGLTCIGAMAVSATTGAGVAELAAAVSSAAEGRNVVVCGAASVGKSTLINKLAYEVSRCRAPKAQPQAAGGQAGGASNNGSVSRTIRTPFEEWAAQRAAAAARQATADRTEGRNGGGAAVAAATTTGFADFTRDAAVGGLDLTESPMPGTTLDVVSIPCLGSWATSLYDTPGVLLSHSLAYSLFPVHLMSPLMEPRPLELKPHLELRRGQTLLLEAEWTAEGDGTLSSPSGPNTTEAPMVLGRVDVTDLGPSDETVHARLLCSAAVRGRVVATADAPETSIAPQSVIDALRASMLAKGNDADAHALGADAAALSRPLSSPGESIRVDDASHTGGERENGAAAASAPAAAPAVPAAAAVDVAFANAGWVTWHAPSGGAFELRARPVAGSSVWVREPLYPS